MNTPQSLPRAAAAVALGALRIAALGSSTTEGVGASSPAASYPARLEAELRAALPGVAVTVANRGRGGEESEDLARRVPGIAAERPDLVIFQTGTNDALRDVPMERFAALTRAGIEAFRCAAIDVVLMEPQYCRQMEEKTGAFAYVEAVRDIGSAYAVPVLRRYELMQRWLADSRLTPAAMVTEDDLHMADGGYAELARAAAALILEGIGKT
jgi:lysophospholipase L1-like esterase